MFCAVDVDHRSRLLECVLALLRLPPCSHQNQQSYLDSLVRLPILVEVVATAGKDDFMYVFAHL